MTSLLSQPLSSRQVQRVGHGKGPALAGSRKHALATKLASQRMNALISRRRA